MISRSIVIERKLDNCSLSQRDPETHVLPFLQTHPSVQIWQQDNARPLPWKTVSLRLNQGVEILPWLFILRTSILLSISWMKSGRLRKKIN